MCLCVCVDERDMRTNRKYGCMRETKRGEETNENCRWKKQRKEDEIDRKDGWKTELMHIFFICILTWLLDTLCKTNIIDPVRNSTYLKTLPQSFIIHRNKKTFSSHTFFLKEHTKKEKKNEDEKLNLMKYVTSSGSRTAQPWMNFENLWTSISIPRNRIW